LAGLARSLDISYAVEDDKLDMEDEKLNPEESAAWKQHKKNLQERGLDAQEEESVVINPGKPKLTNSQPPLTQQPPESRNRSPSRATDPGNRKKDQSASTGIMSRLMYSEKRRGSKAEKLITEQEKKKQKKQKKDFREVKKMKAAVEKQTKKLEKNKAKLLAAQAPPLSVSPSQAKMSFDNFDDIEPIEPIEIPVDDVHSSDEDLEITFSKNYGESGKLIQLSQEAQVKSDGKAQTPMEPFVPSKGTANTPQKEQETKSGYGSDGSLPEEEEEDGEEKASVDA